uniref:TIR domain-containing protein n=1 Tax=Fagus sylvatica TaxID=28930 RepID=A0A2N9GJW0_FAGSY
MSSVSFYGKDTRLLLYRPPLCCSIPEAGFAPLVFRDDRRARERESYLDRNLKKAIETSRIAVIVFLGQTTLLRAGVSMSWQKIMECERRLQQIVLPVFYDVESFRRCGHQEG